MKREKTIIRKIGLISLMGLMSCSGTPEMPETPVEKAVGFAAHFAEGDEGVRAATRAVGDGELTTDLLKEKGFGVYCWYTKKTPFDPDFTVPKTHISDYLAEGFVLMYNQKVEWGGETWGYSPEKYWPLASDEWLTLRAYAPYTSYLLTDAHGMPLLPVVVTPGDYHNGTQHDPLWGTGLHDGVADEDDATTRNEVYGKLYDNYTYTMSGSQLAKDERDGIIDWYFHHGMASLMFACGITPDPGCNKVTITGFSVTPLYTEGGLSLNSKAEKRDSGIDKPTWEQCDGDMEVVFEGGDLRTYPDPLDILINPSGATDAVNLLSKGLLIIPRTYTGTNQMTVTLTYTVDGESDPQTAVGTITREFRGNTSYTLNLSLTPATRGLEISLVQSAFTQWKDGGTGTHTTYNW